MVKEEENGEPNAEPPHQKPAGDSNQNAIIAAAQAVLVEAAEQDEAAIWEKVEKAYQDYVVSKTTKDAAEAHWRSLRVQYQDKRMHLCKVRHVCGIEDDFDKPKVDVREDEEEVEEEGSGASHDGEDGEQVPGDRNTLKRRRRE